MEKKERFLEQLNQAINQENTLYTYKGSKMILVFYGVEDDVEQRKHIVHEATPYLLGNTVHISILKDLFESSMKDNEDLYKEIEDVMWQSTRPLRFAFFPLLLSVFIWFTWSITSMIFPELLYGLPYTIQVLGIIVLALFIYGPLSLRIISDTYMEKYVNRKLFGFHKKLSNKEFRIKYKDYKSKGKKTLRNIEVNFSTPKFLRKVWVKLVLAYSIPLIFVLTISSIMATTLQINIADFGGMMRAYIVETYEIPTMIKSKYSFVEKIDREDSKILYQCGEYRCDSYNGVFTTVYDGDSEIDISAYCDVGVDCSTSINQNLLYIKQFRDIDDNGIDKNLFVDLSANILLYDLKAIDFGFDSSYTMTVYDYVYDEMNSNIYILARVDNEDNRESVLMKIDRDSNYSYVDLSGQYGMNLILFEDTLYFSSYIEEDSFDLNVYTTELDFKNMIELDSQYIPDIFVLNDKVHYVTKTNFFKYVYQLDNNMKSTKVHTHPELLYSYFVANDGFINNSANFKSYREFDSDFNVISKGLFCEECDTEDYFMNRTYIKEGIRLYAYSEENIIVFDESNEYHRSISPGILVSGVSYVILGIVLVFNIFAFLKVKNNKLAIEALKSYLHNR